MPRDIAKIVSDYDVMFHTDVNEVVKNSGNPVDELIFMAKKYVNKLSVDDVTNRELQRFFSLYIEGLYRRKFYWNEINDEINEYTSLIESQNAALKSRAIGYSLLSGMFFMAIHPDAWIAATCALTIGIGTYIGGKKEINKFDDFKQYVVGTYDYKNRLLKQLNNNILSEK
jgi:hypothetical protein